MAVSSGSTRTHARAVFSAPIGAMGAWRCRPADCGIILIRGRRAAASRAGSADVSAAGARAAPGEGVEFMHRQDFNAGYAMDAQRTQENDCARSALKIPLRPLRILCGLCVQTFSRR